MGEFMADKREIYEARKILSRQKLVEGGFKIFAEKTIDAVNLTEAAQASGVGMATVYRHFGTKTALVLEIGTWLWQRISEQTQRIRENEGRTAIETYEYFLDVFIDLYRNHKDVLRFNHFFNVYVQREDVTAEQLEPYNEVIEQLARRFHRVYVKGCQDGTLRTDVREAEMFSSTLHLMLASATRYAVGLIYDNGSDPERELLLLKQMLLDHYRGQRAV